MSDEKITVKSRTYPFFLLSLLVDKKDEAFKDVKIPAGNFPKGFEYCEALTLGQIIQILQVTIKKKLQDIVDGNTGGNGGEDGGTTNPPHPPISCANASFYFRFHTDLNPNTVEASVNGGPWKEISLQPSLEVSYSPANFGAEYIISLSEGLPATKVKIRVENDVVLYVNLDQGIDDSEQENQSYAIFNSKDALIDPFLEANKVYNSSYIDDTASEFDYCVFFKYADFCLEHKTSTTPVGCEGSISSFKTAYLTDGGLYDIFINGQKYNGSRLFRNNEFKNYLATLNIEFNAYDTNDVKQEMDQYGRYDTADTGEFINHSNNYVKIEIAPIDASPINVFKDPINHSAYWDADAYILTVCLAPANS